jgi:glycosyltransferase involved in cell wall biosynthesis
MQPRILIVSPVRNEAAHIERVVRAVAAQELPPARWIVLDDHSTDDTYAILKGLEDEVPFLTVAQAPPKVEAAPVRDRLARAAAPVAFNRGLALAGDLSSYTHVMKLDGDIELPPNYFRELCARFDADTTIGIAGCVLDEPAPDGSMRRIKIAGSHVHGAVKCYTKDCWDAIGGVQELLGWDTVDETYARMRGFQTVSHRDVVSLHLRPLGSADGTVRGHARHGQCAYIAHFQLSWVALRAVKVATRKPYGLSGLAFFYGYVRAAAQRVDRIPDREYRRFTQRELRRRMLGAVLPNHQGAA